MPKLTWADVVIVGAMIALVIVVAPSFSMAGYFIAGIVIGRIYGWMKYHYPEFHEEMNLRVARKRLERARYESRTEEERMRIDALYDKAISRKQALNKRISGTPKVR